MNNGCSRLKRKGESLGVRNNSYNITYSPLSASWYFFESKAAWR